MKFVYHYPYTKFYGVSLGPWKFFAVGYTNTDKGEAPFRLMFRVIPTRPSSDALEKMLSNISNK